MVKTIFSYKNFFLWTIFLEISYTNKVTDIFLLSKKSWALRPLKKKIFSQKIPKLDIFLGLIKTVPVIRSTSFLEGLLTCMCTNYVSNFKSIGQFVLELLRFKVERVSQNYCFDGILEEKKSQVCCASNCLKNDKKSSISFKYA